MNESRWFRTIKHTAERPETYTSSTERHTAEHLNNNLEIIQGELELAYETFEETQDAAVLHDALHQFEDELKMLFPESIPPLVEQELVRLFEQLSQEHNTHLKSLSPEDAQSIDLQIRRIQDALFYVNHTIPQDTEAPVDATAPLYEQIEDTHYQFKHIAGVIRSRVVQVGNTVESKPPKGRSKWLYTNMTNIMFRLSEAWDKVRVRSDEDKESETRNYAILETTLELIKANIENNQESLSEEHRGQLITRFNDLFGTPRRIANENSTPWDQTGSEEN